MPYIEKKKRNNNRSSNYNKRQDVYATSLWKRMRLAYLMEHPLCEICLLEGKTTLGEHVHHKISFVGVDDPIERDRLAYDYNNLMFPTN